VTPVEVSTLAEALMRHWCVDTCDPVDVADWHPGNPSRGQCGSTALVVQEILGGELLVADVLYESGDTQGVHYWNRLPGGVEVDLTRQQFHQHEIVQSPVVVERTRRIPKRLAGQYLLLRNAVLADLGLVDSELAMIWPDSSRHTAETE
jgi:hypothetical protein